MPKKILVIDAHPDCHSFCYCLAEEYFLNAKSRNHDVKIIKVRDLKFDPILHCGYRVPQKLEKDLKEVQKLITWCEHLVIVTPVWWYGTPALFKGFIDRTLLPKYAFSFSSKGVPQKLLKGRSARVIYTQGSPKWLSRFFYKDSFWRSLKIGTLKFCGFSPVKRTYIGSVLGDDKLLKRQKFLKKVKKLGKKGK